MPSDTLSKEKIKKRSGSHVPAYQRIQKDIHTKVLDGRLPAGSMLSSRHNLAREYGVALSTAQQAISNLIADGVLETFDRRGTFVARRPNLESQAVTPVEEMDISRGSNNGHMPLGSTSATLGIIATARIDHTASPDVGSLWARLAIRSLEHVFSASGGTTRYFERYPDDRGPFPRGLDEANAISIPQAIETLRAEGVDAIAIVGLCDAKDMSDEVLSAVDVEHVPTVYISWHEIQPPLAQVFYDNRFAGYQAAQHLLRKGYRELIFLAPFADTWLAERIQGARNAVRHARMPENTLRVYPADPLHEVYDRQASSSSMYALAKTAFSEGWDAICPGVTAPCGIIAPNDDTAYAVLSAGSENGKVAGKDYGLVGFDDDPRSCTIGLTTVRPPVEAMGEEAGRLLLQALQGEKKGQQVRLRSHLIPRTSTTLRA